MKKSYQLGGVSCQVCVNKIEKKLKKLEGTKEQIVNLSTEKLSIDYVKYFKLIYIKKQLNYTK